MFRILLLLTTLFIFNSTLFSQNKMSTKKWRASERDSMERGQLLFDEGNYTMAIPIFEKLLSQHPNELYLKYINGLCGLYRADKHPESLKLLSEVYEKNKKTTDIELDLASANHLNYNFEEALKLIEVYKKKNKVLVAKKQKQVELLTNYCNNGIKLVANKVPATITNIEGPINTEASEYVPVISSDESVMIYTYRGTKSIGGLQNAYNQSDPFGIYYEDVYISYKDSTGHFEEPKDIGPTVNTFSNDAAVAVSPDGQKLFVFKDDGSNGGDLYISHVEGKDWSIPERLNGDINSRSWEGSCSLSSDGKTLYFSSERPGGFGGKDIYYSKLMDDGTWGTAVNMGNKINTMYDDDAPFIHPDNRILLYSSKGKNSMGGYDIFRTVFNPADALWGDPENMGYPINSPDDDIYYVLTADGKVGYYSSGKAGGSGLQDIYRIYPGLVGLTPFLAMIKGRVTLNDSSVKANISIEIIESNSIHSNTESNTSTGKYLVNLPGGSKYKITYKLEGQTDQVKELDFTSITGYTEQTIDINFSTSNKDTIKNVAVNSNPVDPIKPEPASIKPITEPDVNPNNNKSGNENIQGLIFKVQIAAYKMPDNYDYRKLSGLGNVEKLDLDGIARFTIGGEFNSLNTAMEHCKKVRAAGQTDAFVTAIYNGKRVYLEQLEKDGLIPILPK